MYENENENRTPNENMNHEGNMPETTVNWTTPRADQSQNQSQSQNRNGYGPSYGEGPAYGDGRQPDYSNVYSQQQTGGGMPYNNNQGNPKHSRKKGIWVKRAAGITAAAVLFGAVSGGVMIGVNYAGSKMTGTSQTVAQAQPTIAHVAPTVSTQGGQATTTSSTDVSGLVENVMPSIVAINDTMTVQQRDFFGMPQTYEAQGSGSGIIINQTSTELLIATNNHVVDGAQNLKVTFVDNSDVGAAVKGTDSASDLAIVAVQLKDIPEATRSKIKVASLGDSNKVKVGQQVVAIGNALGYGQSVTVGYISALNRTITDENGIQRTYMQTDAAINPGNSGGALLDLNGNVIGINAAKTASAEVEGMGYAIPISKAESVLDNLMTKKTRVPVAENEQGYLGIQGTNIDAATSQEFGMPIGIYVYKIVDGGAAASSGLKEKDIITKFDGQSVSSMEDLKQMLTYYAGGTKVTLTVESLENGAYVSHDVQVTLGTKPAANS